MERVERALSDSRSYFNGQEWKDHCDLVMCADLGINIPEFLDFLQYMFGRELMEIKRISQNIDEIPDIVFEEKEKQDKFREVLRSLGASETQPNSENSELPPNSENSEPLPNSQNRQYLAVFNILSIHDALVKLGRTSW
eukprot:TRINITY_DN14178_c0_g1_i1.p1 TRINITY_DN14178_c0_g1~~TRINITY_DN14178_c0_g1_i1.p1  ORF type:complete len:149 (+),score=27.62 TRINITY_DN14178_c0_g1_i1:31-447(+)